MAENDDRERDGDRGFERQKQEATATLLLESLRFVKGDNDLNDMMKELLGVVVSEVKRNPENLFRRDTDSEAVLSALRAQSSRTGGGVAGGAITGGGPFGDVIDFIKTLGDLAAEEKKFFLKIIAMVLCGCDCVCKCLCDDK